MATGLENCSADGPTVASTLATAASRLRDAGIEEGSRLDAEVLLAAALHTSRSGLFARLREPMPAAAARDLEVLVDRRAQREPLAYVLGGREFWSLWFEVDAATLIPRPETERLVELALDRLRERAAPRVLDVGTGSGCIAVALACERRDMTLTALDISADALRVARANARRHDVASRIDFTAGDIRSAEISGPFDAIVSNPPYVRRDSVPSLAPEVAKWEPRTALVAGDDGLDVIRAVLERATDLLRDGGWLLMEIGSDQPDAVMSLAQRSELTEVSIETDCAGLPRVLSARRRSRPARREKES